MNISTESRSIREALILDNGIQLNESIARHLQGLQTKGMFCLA